MRPALLCAIALGCSNKAERPAPPPPAPGDAAVIDAATETLAGALARIRREKQLPALAVAAWEDGTEVALHATGLRKATGSDEVTVDDPWHLGSNTKAMTAMLVAIYVERGVVTWDDTVAKLFRGERIHPGYAQVTLEQLLRHAGGAPANPPDAIWKRAWKDGDAPGARTRLVRAVLAAPPAQPPGTFVYSNTGYTIAGAALERATKQRWEDLMRRDLFAPLGMASCGFGAPTGDVPWGHTEDGTPVPPGPQADNPPAIGPAGTVHCTLRDYGKFLAVQVGATPLVKPETLARLHTGDDYLTGGWMAVATANGKLLMHSGSNTMWLVTAVLRLDAKRAMVLATNRGDLTVEMAIGQLMPLFPARSR